MKMTLWMTCLWSLVLLSATAQTDQSSIATKSQQTEALNSAVLFTNESIHGLLIVHRLLENLNQQLNRYVDLEGQPLNFYSNKDLPQDIFEDPENWFFETSPKILIQESREQIQSHIPEPYKSEILKDINILWSICSTSNKIRFDLETLLERVAENRRVLNQVYAKLEDAVKLYNQFYIVRHRLESHLENCHEGLGLMVSSRPLQDWYNSMDTLHALTIKGAQNLRFQKIDQSTQLTQEINRWNASLNSQYTDDVQNLLGNSQNKEVNIYLQRISQQVQDYTTDYSEVLSSPATPSRYSQYGDAYYYHNTRILSDINRYGNGLVHEINQMLEVVMPRALYMLEEPHILQIIYPEKLEEEPEDVVAGEVQTSIPEILEDRELVQRKQSLGLQKDIIEIQIYDHQKLDRDIVSLNYNGTWILEEYTITDKPKKIKLRLNQEGENYLILHANNVGVIPPNTMALRYYVDGQRQEVILNSDLNESELIRLTD